MFSDGSSLGFCFFGRSVSLAPVLAVLAVLPAFFHAWFPMAAIPLSPTPARLAVYTTNPMNVADAF